MEKIVLETILILNITHHLQDAQLMALGVILVLGVAVL